MRHLDWHPSTVEALGKEHSISTKAVKCAGKFELHASSPSVGSCQRCTHLQRLKSRCVVRRLYLPWTARMHVPDGAGHSCKGKESCQRISFVLSGPLLQGARHASFYSMITAAEAAQAAGTLAVQTWSWCIGLKNLLLPPPALGSSLYVQELLQACSIALQSNSSVQASLTGNKRAALLVGMPVIK